MLPQFDLGYGPLQSQQILLDAREEIAGLSIGNDGTKTTLIPTIGDYLRVGDAATTQISLDSENDLMVTGELEINGVGFFAGKLFIGNSNVTSEAATGMTTGIQIDQAGVDNPFLVIKSSDVSHLLTDFADADTFFFIKKAMAASGGVHIRTITDADATSAGVVQWYVQSGVAADTTKSTAGRGLIEFYPSLIHASNGSYENMTADGNIFALRPRVGGSSVSVLIVDEDGDLWLNGGITAEGVLETANSAEGGTGRCSIKSKREVVSLTGAQTSTTFNIPDKAMLLGASFNVDTAVVTSAAGNTWDADYTGGSTTNLVAATASGSQNTKGDALIVPEVASATTNIEFDAPGAETFSSGAIEVVAYYIDLTSLADA